MRFTTKTVEIAVNGKTREVYRNQTVLQALFQINECIQHGCIPTQYYHMNKKSCDCSVKIENFSRYRDFKACLAPVETGMRIFTSK